MSAPHKDDATVDVLVLPEAREACKLYESACEKALEGGSRPPQVEQFLKGVAESELFTLQQELQRVAQDYEQRLSQQTKLPKRPTAAPAADPNLTAELPAAPGDITTNGVASKATVDTPAPGQDESSHTAAFVLSEDQGTMEHASNGHHEGDTELTPAVKEKLKPPQIAGYDIVGVLGRGAMGVVYKARQRGLKRLVALKMILAGDHAGARDLARFKIEAEAVAQFQHPNIVQIYEVGEQDGKPFFSLEYIEGECLGKKVSGAPLGAREAADLVRQMALAMQYAHEKGVIHRDLKPANILLTKDGSPKITDFGLAKRVGEDSGQTQSGSVLGTPSYMPPEQAEGRLNDVGPLSDVYSLGAILYELLTGRAPFKSATLLDTLQQVRKQEPVSLAQLQPGTPRDLETISLKCLQKDPKKRYANAAALAEDLRRYLANEPILARPTPLWEHAWRWAKRNPVVASLSAAVAALIFGILVGLLIGLLVINTAKNEAVQAKNAEEKEKNRANENAETATKEAHRANKNADTALDRQYAAVNHAVDMAEAFQRSLRRASANPQLEPQLRPLRAESLKAMRDNLGKLAKEIDNKEITSFGTAMAHQKMGDMFHNLGMAPEAVEQYQLALDTAKHVAEAKPGEDKGRANWALLLDRLGRMDMESRGDLPAAREKFEKALALQEDVEANPRNLVYTVVDNKRLKANYLVSLGRVSLLAGDPAAARKYIDQALEYRLAWQKADNKNALAKNYLSEAYMLKSDVSWRLGDIKEMDTAFAEAGKIMDEVIETNPKVIFIRADRAEANMTYAEALHRLGKWDQAKENYDKSSKLLKDAIDKDPESMRYLGLVARQKRGQGLAAEKLNDAAAAQYFADELKWRERIVVVDTENMPEQIAYLTCLARNGKQADAAKKADALADKVARDPQLGIELAGCYAVCAGKTQDAAEKQRFTDKAVELLRNATKDGYKDRENVVTDPNLEALRDNAGFKEMADKLK